MKPLVTSLLLLYMGIYIGCTGLSKREHMPAQGDLLVRYMPSDRGQYAPYRNDNYTNAPFLSRSPDIEYMCCGEEWPLLQVDDMVMWSGWGGNKRINSDVMRKIYEYGMAFESNGREWLIAMAKRGDTELKIAAIRALAKYADDEVETYLFDVLEDDMRGGASFFVVKDVLNRKCATERQIDYLVYDRHYRLNDIVVGVLGDIGDCGTADRLIGYLKNCSRDGLFLAECINTIGKVGDIQHLEYIRTMKESENDEIQKWVRRAEMNILIRHSTNNEIQEYLLSTNPYVVFYAVVEAARRNDAMFIENISKSLGSQEYVDYNILVPIKKYRLGYVAKTAMRVID